MLNRTLFVSKILFLMILFAGIILSCEPEKDDDQTTYTVTFTFTNIDTHDGVGAHDGETLYGKLTTTDCSGTSVVWGSAVIVSDTAVIAIDEVPEGTYIGCGFIDVNANAVGDGSSLPDTGDYTGDSGGLNIVITEDQPVAIDTTNWVQL